MKQIMTKIVRRSKILHFCHSKAAKGIFNFSVFAPVILAGNLATGNTSDQQKNSLCAQAISSESTKSNDLSINRKKYEQMKGWQEANVSATDTMVRDLTFATVDLTLNNTHHTDQVQTESYYNIKRVTDGAFLKNNLWEPPRLSESFRHFRLFSQQVLKREAISVWGNWTKFVSPRSDRMVTPGDAGILVDENQQVQENFVLRHTAILTDSTSLKLSDIYLKISEHIREIGYSKRLSHWVPMHSKPASHHWIFKDNGNESNFDQAKLTKKITGAVKAQLRNAFIFGKRTDIAGIEAPIYRKYNVIQYLGFDDQTHCCFNSLSCAIKDLDTKILSEMVMNEDLGSITILAKKWAVKITTTTTPGKISLQGFIMNEGTQSYESNSESNRYIYPMSSPEKDFFDDVP